jgi:hypothetical protein
MKKLILATVLTLAATLTYAQGNSGNNKTINNGDTITQNTANAAAGAVGIGGSAVSNLTGGNSTSTSSATGGTSNSVGVGGSALAIGGSATGGVSSATAQGGTGGSSVSLANGGSGGMGGQGGVGGQGGSAISGPSSAVTGASTSKVEVTIGCTTDCVSDKQVQADKAIAAGHDKAIVTAAQQDIKNTPSMFGPALVSSNDTCMGSTSGSVAAPGLGISFGSTWVDENCKMLKNSERLWNMGMKAASIALLCTDEKIKEALDITGFTCPQRPVPTRTEVSN